MTIFYLLLKNLGEKIKAWIREGTEAIRIIGDVRGRGLMISIEMVEDKNTREPLNRDAVCQKTLKHASSGRIFFTCSMLLLCSVLLNSSKI